MQSHTSASTAAMATLTHTSISPELVLDLRARRASTRVGLGDVGGRDAGARARPRGPRRRRRPGARGRGRSGRRRRRGAANSRAHARPTPADAPVIATTLPFEAHARVLPAARPVDTALATATIRRRDARPRFQMREKLVSIGDDSWIEDDQGERVYKVDGKALRIRDTFVLEDRDGNEVAKIQERKLSVRDTMAIERDGDTVATVHKALVGFRDRFKIEVEDGEDLRAHGNILDHEYEIRARRRHRGERVEEVVPDPRHLRRRDP